MHNQLPGQIGQQTFPVQEKITTTTFVQSSTLPQTNITQTRGLNNTNFGHVGVGQQPLTGPLSGAQNKLSHHTIGNSGVGTITFRPIEGRFTKDKDWIGNMDPYCKFKIGWRTGKSSVAKSQGVNPVWAGDVVTLKIKNHEYAKLKCKDKDRLRPDSRLGKAHIPLAQVVQQGKVTQWVPVMKRGAVTGEVHLEMTFTPRY